VIKSLVNRVKGKGNITSLLSNIVSAFANFFVFFVLVRIVSPTVFGNWVLFLTLAALTDMFRLGLTGTAAIRLLAEKPDENKIIIGSSYYISFKITLIIAVISLPVALILMNFIGLNAYVLFLLYYPLLALANLPLNQALVNMQGYVNFKNVFFIRTIQGILTIISVLGCIFFISKSIHIIILAYTFAQLFTSLFVLIRQWDQLASIKHYSKNVVTEILTFGKYSTLGFVGSNLLRSADSIIISMAPTMGVTAIAIYAIPLKFVELVEIPLRSFNATALPRLTRALTDGNAHFMKVLLGYTLWTIILVLPAILLLAIFPSYLLQFLGGNNYLNVRELQIGITYVLCIYIFLLPLDRYSGVALFALNKPKENVIKIFVMLFFNIIFDIIAVFVLKSLLWVAIASVIFTLVGIFLGWAIVFAITKYKLKNTKLNDL